MQCVEWIVPGLPRCRQPRAPPGEGPEKMSLLAGGPDPRPSTRQKMRLPIGRAAAIDKTSRRHIFPPRFRWRGAACRPLPERERERGEVRTGGGGQRILDRYKMPSNSPLFPAGPAEAAAVS